MTKRSKRKDDEPEKPLPMRAKDLADWLEGIQDSASLWRMFRFWWNRHVIIGLAIDALDELAEFEKKNGMHDKLRRSLNTMVMAMGGAELKWSGSAGKKDE